MKKNIIISGVSRGLGKALTLQFLAEPDFEVIGLSRNTGSREIQHLKAISAELPGTFLPFQIKPSVEKDFVHFTKFLSESNRKIDILINNAGILVKKPFDTIDHSAYINLFDVNFWYPFKLTQCLLPFLSQGSHVLNIGSMGGFQGSAKFPGLSIYSASKAALANLTECLAEELKPRDIFVNCLALGSVQTEMLHQAFPDYKAASSAEQMASYIFRFATEAHQFMNGKIIPISNSTP